jgi:hypothetical protein
MYLRLKINQSSQGRAFSKKKVCEYVRQLEMELVIDSSLIIVDFKAKTIIRLINIYRCFNPQEGIRPKAKFLNQLDLKAKQ